MVPVPATADDWNGILCHQELLISLHCSDCSDSMQSDSFHSRLAHYQLLQETAKAHIFIWMWRLAFIVVTIHRLRYKLSQQYGHLCTYHIQRAPGKAKESSTKQRRILYPLGFTNWRTWIGIKVTRRRTGGLLAKSICDRVTSNLSHGSENGWILRGFANNLLLVVFIHEQHSLIVRLC